MTIFYPDVSNWQEGLSLAGAPAVVAKASQGNWYRDPDYEGFKAQAAAAGVPFAAYHWLDTTDAAAQARFCYSVVGPGVPLMIDDEQPIIAVEHTLAFVHAYRAQGGLVTLEYAPRWVWQASGEPDLTPLAAAGLAVVSSHYTSYSDTGPGWEPYGGITPAIWQYTSSQPINGQAVDFNAYRGSLAELATLFHGRKGSDMLFLVNAPGEAGIWLSDGFRRRPVYPVGQAQLYLDHGAIRLAGVDLSWFGDPAGTGSTLPLSPDEFAQISQAAHDGAAAGVHDQLDGANLTVHTAGQ